MTTRQKWSSNCRAGLSLPPSLFSLQGLFRRDKWQNFEGAVFFSLFPVLLEKFFLLIGFDKVSAQQKWLGSDGHVLGKSDFYLCKCRIKCFATDCLFCQVGVITCVLIQFWVKETFYETIAANELSANETLIVSNQYQ